MAWLTDHMGYNHAEVLATDRLTALDGYEGAVYAISTRVVTPDYQGNSGTLCWGVVVGAHDGKVINAVGGEIGWLQC